MTKRERVFTAMDRRQPDRVPKSAGFTPAVQAKFEEMTGQTDAAAYFDYDSTAVGFAGPAQMPDFTPWYPDGLPEGTGISEYGTAHKPGSFLHFWQLDFPLKRASSVAELEDFPWPDYTPAYRHGHLEADVARLHQDGWYVQGAVGHIWENCWQITSMEKLMMDFIEHPDQAAYVLDRVTENALIMAKRFAEAGCDSLLCGDDIGMQHKLMFSPALWREWFKPRWASVWKAAKEIKPDIQIWYHSDGNIVDVIPELIEIGLDILNPVQPECMDPAWLKAEYGDRLAFWGCVGTQTTFPFGTPDDVRQAVKGLIETVGKGGGLYLAPTHVLEPDVPWENIAAYFEAVHDYGTY
jgi:uroporphyrinogen decarboxylase